MAGKSSKKNPGKKPAGKNAAGKKPVAAERPASRRVSLWGRDLTLEVAFDQGKKKVTSSQRQAIDRILKRWDEVDSSAGMVVDYCLDFDEMADMAKVDILEKVSPRQLLSLRGEDGERVVALMCDLDPRVDPDEEGLAVVFVDEHLVGVMPREEAWVYSEFE